MTMIRGELQLTRGVFSLEVDFEISAQGTTALCGRSGAGKSSLLRCLAGLEPDATGRVEVAGDCWFDSRTARNLPPHERAVGFVTQEPFLFEHLNVRDNLRYGVKRARDRQVNEVDVIESLGLSRFIDRDVRTLSGGERQRVAIGRALLRSPRVLLLDEPVSALDAGSRHEVLSYLQRVLRQFALPCLYVSHDLREAARVSDRMMWLEQGRIVAHGPSAHVLTDLRLPFAELDEAEGILSVRVEAHHDDVHLTSARCGDDLLWLPQLDLPTGSPARVQIAARDVSLALSRPSDVSILNVLHARIADLHESAHLPGQMLVRLAVGDESLLARVTRKSAQVLQLRKELEVWALVKAVALVQ